MKKTKILFVIESLACAGAEKSLLSLLNNIDETKYEIDLQLFSHGAILQSLLPNYVNVLPEFNYTSICKIPILRHILNIRSFFSFRVFISRIIYSLLIRCLPLAPNRPIHESVWYWKLHKNVIPSSNKSYDIAIAYAQGVPTFYVGDKVHANSKLAWVNCKYTPKKSYKKYLSERYKFFKKIICVSPANKDTFNNEFPVYSKRTHIMPDINDAALVRDMASAYIPKEFQQESTSEKPIILLTVGRLAPMKGYDVLVEAAKILRNHEIRFKWYILGIGPLESVIKAWIKSANLEDYIYLLGLKSNPYPYFKKCDIYVQTSRFEGFPLTLSEAMILTKPIVSTKFDSVHLHMKHEINCLLSEIQGESVALNIERLIEDNALRKKLKQHLENTQNGNVYEIKKFYEIINSD